MAREFYKKDENKEIKIATEAVEAEIKPVVELLEFEQAFRIYKRSKFEATTWSLDSVHVFVKKNFGKELAPINEWIDVFNKY